MNRIVRERYPVSNLPEDLRPDVGDTDAVRVTIEVADHRGLPPDAGSCPRPGLFSQYRHHIKTRFTSLEEVNDHVRALREEWDHRDR